MNNDRRFPYYSLAVAAFWLAVYELLLDGLLGYPLRLVSAHIAAGILGFVGVKAELSGAAIITPAFEFDVSAECSGSTTLKFMIATAIILLAFAERLNWRRKAVALLISVLLALVVNSLRVSAIVYISVLMRSPLYEDGAGHVLTGMMAYVAALALFWLVMRRLEAGEVERGAARAGSIILCVAGFIVLFAPLADQTLRLLTSSEWEPSAPWNIVFLVVGAALFVDTLRFSRKSPSGGHAAGFAIPLFCVALTLAAAARWLEVVALQSPALLLLLLSLAAALGGAGGMLRALPGLCILGMGLPRLFLLVQGLLLWREQEAGAGELFFVRLGGMCLLAGVHFAVCARVRGCTQTEPAGRGLAFRLPGAYGKVFLPGLVIAGLAALVGVVMVSAAPEADRITIPYYIAPWLGEDIELTSEIGDLAGQEALICRRYQSGGGEFVDLLVSGAGGNRGNIHPPEYCFTSAGWKVTARESLWLQIPDRVGVMLMSLERGGEELYLAYWFGDGRSISRFYFTFVLQDIYNRFRGQRADWKIYRVAAAESRLLHDFLETAGARLISAE